jgi:Poly A polymerase head domain
MIQIGEHKLRKEFQEYFIQKMKQEDFICFFYDVFTFGTAYIVGGFFRDFINNKPSRDVDIIVDLKNEQLIEILKELNFDYSVNRHGGIKIKLHSIEADVWSIENNWAFRNKLVKLNEDDKLNSIAKGCFYNYDSLVINLNSFNYNLRHYKEFLETQKLNILQERTIYKHLNLSIEANILRAFYVKHIYKISYTTNTESYLNSKLGHLWDKYGDPIGRLLKIKETYTKYNILDKKLIEYYIKELKSNISSSSPSLFEF